MDHRIFIDTNIILDYFLKREPFYNDSKAIINLCKDSRVKGCIASHSVSNIFYILRKEYTTTERRILLTSLCSIMDVEGIDKEKILIGLENEDFTDFEDCLQVECAKAYGAEYIVTRNVDDYKLSEIKAMTPKDYLGLIN